MTEPTDVELLAEWDRVSHIADAGQRRLACLRAVLAKWGTPPAVAGGAIAEVVMAVRPPKASPAWLPHKIIHASLQWLDSVPVGTKLYTAPQPTQAQAGAVPLTDREIELIDGMIQVQLDHASRCDAIANRSMADKQKGWDMERVALLQKLKARGIKGGLHGADT